MLAREAGAQATPQARLTQGPAQRLAAGTPAAGKWGRDECPPFSLAVPFWHALPEGTGFELGAQRNSKSI